MNDALTSALRERDEILTAMDVEAAKAFISRTGGFRPGGKVDWLRILHLARFEVTSMPQELRTESQVYLARTGAESISGNPPSQNYLRAAIDLIFPKRLTDAHIEETMSHGITGE